MPNPSSLATRNQPDAAVAFLAFTRPMVTMVPVLGACLLVACEGAGGEPETLFRQGRYAAALSAWERAAESGDASAGNRVGVQYQLGLGVDRDYAAALAWYRRAAAAGDVHAQRNLGLMYENGYGVPVDNQLAYGWYERARGGGHTRARRDTQRVGNLLTPNMILQSRDLIAAEIAEISDNSAQGAIPSATPGR